MLNTNLVASSLALLLLVGNPCNSNSDNERVFVEELQAPTQIEEVIDEYHPRYRERLEQQVSRGEIRKVRVETTAYDDCENKTASGTTVKHGTVAVDPRVFGMGTKFYIPDYGIAYAEDTGGAVKGHILDLWMEDEKDCIKWGRKTVEVYILEEGE